MTAPSPELSEKCVNTIRFLAADGVQKANSGHPGLPMGAAEMAFVLWTRHLRYDPSEPRWLGRDRFLLSAGHGSMLLYSLLHLAGFDVPIEELQRFRQLHSATPGHPEFGFAPGVEITSGPLGQGFANGVGFALGQAMLSARLGPGNPLEDHFTYAIVSDGDLMEGISSEAGSFAGYQKLGRLVYLYDDNGITIDGKTSITFTEDVTKRFEAFGWQVLSADGQDRGSIDRALTEAKAELTRPSLVRVKTVIGFGAPKKAGTSGVHGSPLGEEELAAARKNLGWPAEPRFLVPDDVRAFWKALGEERRAERAAWDERTKAWRKASPEKAELLDAHAGRKVPSDLRKRLLEGADAQDATRKLSQALLQKASALVPALAGGSADLFESNLTEMKGGGLVSPESRGARSIGFGIREHAMGAIVNGMAYDGLFIPYDSTFLIFSDYERPTVRLAAISKLQRIFIWTHDSIFLGEDGPTHQPIEHLCSLRAIPELHLVRPADGLETAAAWVHALERRDGPTGFALTRQKLGKLERPASFTEDELFRGGYVVREDPSAKVTLVATGSEVFPCQEAAKLLAEKGIPTRVVSVPCLACFEAQPAEYRDRVVPPSHRVAVFEAARGLEWWRLAGKDGLVHGIDRFGASAPEKALAEEYGFTPAKIAERVEGWLTG